MKVKKSNGTQEEFSRKKTMDSVVKAGGTQAQAKEVSDKLKPHDGMCTSDLRKGIIKELNLKNPKAAKSYDEFKK